MVSSLIFSKQPLYSIYLTFIQTNLLPQALK